MKNIVVLVHDDPGQEARLQAALDLTRAVNGHLTCVAVTAMPVITGEFYASSAELEMIAIDRERGARIREQVESRLRGEDVSWSWDEKVGQIAASLADAAALADVIVVNRALDSARHPNMRAIASKLVLSSGRAVLAVPEAASGIDFAGAALIAWDGSEEADHALQAAVPLLRLARSVTLLEIDGADSPHPAETAAAYLSRHGIKPVVTRKESGVFSTDEVLRAETLAQGADYLVMGGFGQSRIVEALTGGTSRRMLADSPIPTLMKH